MTFESNDPVTDYRDAEIDSLAVQPATFTYTDGTGQHTGNNPQAGLVYPSGLVWRYVESKVSQPVYDINHDPVYNTPGDPMSGQRTIELRTYTQGAAGLAPAFETTKGGLNMAGQEGTPAFDSRLVRSQRRQCRQPRRRAPVRGLDHGVRHQWRPA